MVGNTEENGPFWFVSLMMMVAALGSHSSQGLYANSSFCHQPHTREMGHLRLGLGRFSRRAELSCCFYPPPFWEWGREDLGWEREGRGVPNPKRAIRVGEGQQQEQMSNGGGWKNGKSWRAQRMRDLIKSLKSKGKRNEEKGECRHLHCFWSLNLVSPRSTLRY